MSLKFIPSDNTRSQVNATSFSEGSPSVNGALPDALRNGGHKPVAQQINGKHALQQRLENWDETQMDFKMETYRRLYGSGEPIRRAMEMSIVNRTDVPTLMGDNAQIHQAILSNKDSSLDWEDVYDDSAPVADVHTAMSKRMGI